MQFVDRPPTDAKMPLPVMRPRPNHTLRCTCATRSYVGLMTHYIGGRTIDHGDPLTCVGCLANMIPRWQGYIIVQSTENKSHAVLQFTPLVANVLTQTSWAGTGLLGLTIEVRRMGPRINSPLECKIIGKDDDVIEYPVQRLRELVELLFGIRTLDNGRTAS